METREKLRQILLEWSEYEIPKIYLRDFDWRLIEDKNILSIIGARRAGKTYLCYQIIQQLRKSLPKDNIIYINFEDERLYPLKGDELTLLWEICFELFSVDLTKRVYLFVDEIQNAKNWSKWTRRITDQNKNLKLIITGSSSKLLSREIATELRGRTLSFTVFPLSFSEYLRAKAVPFQVKNILYSSKRAILKKQFNNYFKTGGFPAVLDAPNPKELLSEYYRVMFYRDLIERYKIKNIKLFEDYLTLLIDQTAFLTSISSTAKKLAEFGHSFSKNTLSNFSRYAQEVFLIFETRQYSYKLKEQLRAPKKIYTIDHGLVRAIRFSFSEDYGRILENIVYLSLKREKKEVYYHKDRKECDFLIVSKGRVREVLQVTKSITDIKTSKREIEGLLEATTQHRLKQGLILTDDHHKTIKISGVTIKILPVWYWLLEPCLRIL